MNTPTSAKIRRMRLALIIGVAVILPAVVLWLLTRDRLVAPTDSPVAITQFVATDRFVSLPPDQKLAYVKRLEQLTFEQRREVAKQANLSPEQAKAAYRNVFRQAAQYRVERYFSITDEAQRRAYLDALIDEFDREQTFARREPLTPAQIKAQLESMPPGKRAQMAQFLGEFATRRLVRGLTPFQQ